MTGNVPPTCMACIYHHPATLQSCKAYPVRIPDEILTGAVSHLQPRPGDRGMQFRRNTQHPAYFMISEDDGNCLFRITSGGQCERYIPLLDIWEADDTFVRIILEAGLAYFRVNLSKADAFIRTSRRQKEAINPCSLQIRQMMYLRTRDNPQK